MNKAHLFLKTQEPSVSILSQEPSCSYHRSPTPFTTTSAGIEGTLNNEFY